MEFNFTESSSVNGEKIDYLTCDSSEKIEVDTEELIEEVAGWLCW